MYVRILNSVNSRKFSPDLFRVIITAAIKTSDVVLLYEKCKIVGLSQFVFLYRYFSIFMYISDVDLFALFYIDFKLLLMTSY